MTEVLPPIRARRFPAGHETSIENDVRWYWWECSCGACSSYFSTRTAAVVAAVDHEMGRLSLW